MAVRLHLRGRLNKVAVVRARRQSWQVEAKETAAFAKRLRETRQARGLSQRAFADVGVSYATSA
jgi:hypothetical protein